MVVTPPKSLHVLFIGNSFTARNDVPGLIAGLARARDVHLDHRLISVGGASLRTHWNMGKAQKEIESGKYDHVVLQEQSTLPIKNRSRMHENIRLFDPIIRAAGGKTTLYLTWARQQAPDTQQAIIEAYESIGREIGAVVVPVGIAWQQFLKTHDRPVLHDKDKSHPTAVGSYLAACVFFAVLFGQNPVGVKTVMKGLRSDEIQLLQEAAQRVARR